VVVFSLVVSIGLAALGQGEDPGAELRSHRAEFESIAERLMEGSNPYLGTEGIGRLRARLEAPGLSAQRGVSVRMLLANLLLRQGENEEAAALHDEAMRIAEEHGARLRASAYRARGKIHLRRAEVANCIERHNAACCVFPIAGEGVHTDREPAREAFESYLRAVEDEPSLETMWLLNVSAMALGEHPGGVPEAYRIPLDRFESAHDIGRFVDVAPVLGVDALNLCGGVIADDMDGDGLLDIVTSSFDPGEPLRFYRSDGEGGFEDLSDVSRASDQLGGLNIVAADYDDDGDRDVLVLRGAWLNADGEIRNSLLRNDGGVFVDVTHEAGLAQPARPTQAAAWADFDNDGDLDLYVANESMVEISLGAKNHPGQLFRNKGDGTFEDVAASAGVTNDRMGKGVCAGDYDDDGDMDLYVSNIGGNRLYRNRGDGTFVDVAPELGVTAPESRSFACWFFDYDNDEDLDLFVGAYDADIGDLAADALGRGHDATAPCLYRNEGDGTFSEVARELGLGRPSLPMGANFGDFDHDGYLDMLLGTGDPGFETLMPNVALRNDAGRGFQDVTLSGGFGHLQKGHGIAFADFDNDGDQDVYHQLGGFFPADVFHNALYQSPGHGNRFVYVSLRGVKSNRSGIGCRITVRATGPEGRRTFHRAVGSVSSFGGSPLLRQEIGLGDSTGIERVEVWWPASGVRQAVDGVELDTWIEVIEGAAEARVLELRRMELGG